MCITCVQYLTGKRRIGSALGSRKGQTHLFMMDPSLGPLDFPEACSTRVAFQILNEPSVYTYYLGEERNHTWDYDDEETPEWWPRSSEIPLPNYKWSDYFQTLDKPYEGAFSMHACMHVHVCVGCGVGVFALSSVPLCS